MVFLLMFKIAILTQGKNVPSTRFRILQYLATFNSLSIETSVYHAYESAYPPPGLLRRLSWLLKEISVRFWQIVKINFSDVDLVIIQRELISTLPTFEWCLTKKFIFDVDDAIFLHKNGIAARAIAKTADAVVCGNSFLSNYFSKFNSNVYEICTPVDSLRFKPSDQEYAQKYIGWSGSSSGYHYLHSIESEIKKVLEMFPDWKLLIVADKPPEFKILTENDFCFEKWHPDTEVSSIQKMSIGIMPLEDNDWAKGKCSYKMLLYMACAVPCVVSDVGMNSEILAINEVGLGVPCDTNGWSQALTKLVSSSQLRAQMGFNGRSVIESHFSLVVSADKWFSVIKSRLSSQ